MMKRTTRLALGAAICYLWGASNFAAGAQRSASELLQYIHEARGLGLSDDQIRKNALTAGWDRGTVQQAYAALASSASSPAASNRSAVPQGYRIGAGDVLQILVWREPEASVAETVVRADGRISVPLIKEVDAAGLTPAELEKALVEKFSRYITAPDVTVVARQIHSRKIYLVGAVRREGPIPLMGPLTVLQAINEGGGVTEYAKKKKIYILRQHEGKQERLPFDYQAVLKGERMEQNVVLLPDDTIVVPQ
jgi:polysaccharide export outer membrane protein